MDIVVWLRSLGLAEYEADFRKNHIVPSQKNRERRLPSCKQIV
jgi:hypothetical protein